MSGIKKNPKNKRKNMPHASLIKRVNSRIRQEYLDMDYLDKLDDTVKNCEYPDGTPCTELEYMSSFMSEWNNASIASGSVKDKTGEKAKENKFHRTPEEAKTCTDRNNARNRCMLSNAKAQNMVHKEDYAIIVNWLEEKEPISNNYVEEAMVRTLDEVEKLRKAAKKTKNSK